MKGISTILWVLLFCVILLSGFRRQRNGTVSGKVVPADAATQVWLFTQRDTLHGALKNGAFEIAAVRPGTCVLVLDALAPYKRTIRSGIEVYEGIVTNVGEILLEK